MLEFMHENFDCWHFIEAKLKQKLNISLDDRQVLRYPINAQSVVFIHTLINILSELQQEYDTTFCVFYKPFVLLQIKCYQMCIIIEQLLCTTLIDDWSWSELINCPIAVDLGCLCFDTEPNFAICTDLLLSVIDNIKRLSVCMSKSKDRLDMLANACSFKFCVVCKEKQLKSMHTECGHEFCHECYIKCQSIKNECPVCRSVKKFCYTPSPTRNLTDKIKLNQTHFNI
ncbi:hypothetical protein SlGVgp012 [Spodoptera litura granulovirus]|uniref:RING-type domain-containing protein n=1 Tax=Spodoptera litura granulovirus TaxID=359919 RepID=A5IZL4_9BBAC|nr:hypothetical protein SlGVgp012 [Spodoptera litura granulovirus]ABQ51955.1 hypothetical protein SlGVgp012 [Spodoptera litura granulovirus]